MSSVRALCVSLIAFVTFACGGSTEPAQDPPVTEAAVRSVAPPSSALVIADGATEKAPDGPVPVTAEDPSRGSDAAPVTLVMFGDFECPYSAKAARTVEDLQAKYGPERLRVVFKHHPLPFRKIAPMMHEEAAAAFRAGGNPAFWAYFHHVFVESDRADGFDVIRERALGAASEASPDLEQKWNDAVRAGAAEKVAADIALGKENGVRGTPAFFINGVFVGGSQDKGKFEAVIDAELRAARPKLVGGRAPAGWYAARTAENRKNAPPPQETKPEPSPPDLTVWKVPVGKSPVRGPADALVTIVAFGDFQCPFTAKAQATLAELMRRYPTDVRVVFKHRPLSFHKKAEPAHELAQEIFAKKGNEAFWKAHDMLFESSSNLDEATLTRVAKEAGLSPPAALAAVKAQKHRKVIVEDEALAEDFEAGSTPHFFINGRRLVGARKIEELVALVDERLAEARTIEQGGVTRAKVYDEIMKSAKAGATPEKRKAPPVPATAPFRGAKNAPVVIQVFSNLQCPFCKKTFAMLPKLEKEFPGQLKIVWRDLPLPMHKQAQPAAVALHEVHRLKGDDAFWKMVDAVYDKQQDLGPELWEKAASDLGVGPDKLRTLDGSSASGKLVEAELAEAKRLDVKATPSIFVNDYFVSGAHEAKLRAAIKRSLREKTGR